MMGEQKSDRAHTAMLIVSYLDDMTIEERISFMADLLNNLGKSSYNIVADMASKVPLELTQVQDDHINRFTQRAV
jgi:hypothetical protein